MKEHGVRFVGLILMLVLLYSCSETKSLEEGQYLYDGAKIKIEAKPPLTRSKKRDLSSELENLLRQETQRQFSGHSGQIASL